VIGMDVSDEMTTDRREWNDKHTAATQINWDKGKKKKKDGSK
jgi:hypothetical protein